ncbi:MAG: T9SS type A sorting domain-containing protein [Lewinellaceae bacterium]|nr:T9SS type A sorting domain-containing protein [Saprospiraceae bacterium]MCB9312187.1 T9SS type A sorting domain-containing protein [Lewinellaceae bacterium]
MRHFTFLILFFFGAQLISAQTNEVQFTFNHHVNGEELKLNETLFTIWNGKTMRIDRAEFYLAEISLIGVGGGKTTLSDQYILADAGDPEMVWNIGNVNLDEIEGVEVHIGVDQAKNHLDPSTYQLGHPLGFQDPSMHWGWSAGYRFMAIEGYVDQNNDGIPESLFQYHNLGDNLYYTTSIDGEATADNGVLTVNIDVDYAKLFEGMTLIGNLIHHGSNSQNQKMLTNASTEDFLTISAISAQDDVVQNSLSLTATPNPAQGQILLAQDLDPAIGSVDLKVMNVMGQMVAYRQNVPAQGELQLDLDGWQTGTYFYGLYHNGRLIARSSFMVQ